MVCVGGGKRINGIFLFIASCGVSHAQHAGLKRVYRAGSTVSGAKT